MQRETAQVCSIIVFGRQPCRPSLLPPKGKKISYVFGSPCRLTLVVAACCDAADRLGCGAGSPKRYLTLARHDIVADPGLHHVVPKLSRIAKFHLRSSRLATRTFGIRMAVETWPRPQIPTQ